MTSHGRLGAAFETARGRGETLLVGYLMAGDPSPDAALGHARAVLRGGADVLEVGVPFSDPVADGPVIERAGVRALAAGANAGDALGMVAHLRRETRKPLVLMTYYNPVYRAGLASFCSAAAGVGADGLVVPDLPLEESAPLRAACDAAGLDLVLLASPATDAARTARIAAATRGFLYLVSSYGVTGVRGALGPDVPALVREAKKVAGDVPLAVGFGVSTPEHVAALRAAGADGVIVGSHLVRAVEAGTPAADLEAEVGRLKAACLGKP